MRRLLLLLIMLAFGVTQGLAAPMALCQHSDAGAHAAALASSDAETATAAHHEEDAAAAVEKQGSQADAAGGAFGNVLVPGGPALPVPGEVEAMMRWIGDLALLAGRAIAPPVEPPLG